MKNRYSLFFFIACIFFAAGSAQNAEAQATQTPVPVIIVTTAPSPTQGFNATATPTAESLQVTGQILLEARAEAGEVNVRALPDINAQRLGVIRAGESYVVRGRYFSWYQFDFASSPTGTAWVYGELVTIIGNENQIRDTDPYAVPTSAADAYATQTLEAILANPGGDATATAAARVLTIPTPTPGEAVNFSEVSGDLLPTYTPPAEYNLRSTAAPSTELEGGSALFAALTDATSTRIPPMVPVAALGLSGVIGLAISILRR
jgi:hypothetical protein